MLKYVMYSGTQEPLKVLSLTLMKDRFILKLYIPLSTNNVMGKNCAM